jgi:hypothetical protein
MAAPARRRPGSDSPIKLVADVEQVRTPGGVADDAAGEFGGEVAATAPTAAPGEPHEQQESTIVPVSSRAPRPAKQPIIALPADDGKTPVTFSLRTTLKKRAETAVLRTAGYQGGYTSMAALVDGALERELERLAREFNNGEAYPPNAGTFRQGRPFGS